MARQLPVPASGYRLLPTISRAAPATFIGLNYSLMPSQLREVWRLGLPVSITFAMQMVIIMVDSAFAGHLSYTDLAAVSLTSSIYHILLLLLIGICIGTSVQGGMALGAGNRDDMINAFRQGALLCTSVGFLLATLLPLWFGSVTLLGQEQAVVDRAMPYVSFITWTLPVQALLILCRNYFAVNNSPWKSVLPVLLALALNALLDYVLSQGRFGFPNMGIAGIGLASLISNLFMLVLMLHAIGWRTSLRLFQFHDAAVWSHGTLLKLILVSTPIVIALVVEEFFFSGTVLLSGFLGAAEQAAQQILLNTIGTSFLFNAGLGVACAILIGKHTGAGNQHLIAPTVKSGLVLAQVFTVPFALILAFGGDHWAGLFLDRAAPENAASLYLVNSVIWLAIGMLFIDSVWLIFIEALHGLQDNVFPAIASFVSYWLFAIPLGFVAANHADSPFQWIWVLMVVAGIMLTTSVMLRLRFSVKAALNRQAHDSHG